MPHAPRDQDISVCASPLGRNVMRAAIFRAFFHSGRAVSSDPRIDGVGAAC